VSWNLVSALAAIGALFAWETVRETRALRREDRLARLPELVADLGGLALKIKSGYAHGRITEWPIVCVRLEAAIAASGERLPRCDHLLCDNLLADDRSLEDVTEQVDAALDELAELMRSDGRAA
jgi:hypothetical protein